MAQIAIAATFTATPLMLVLDYWLSRLGGTHQVRWAEEGDVFQPLLKATGTLRANRGGINVLLVRRAELGADATRVNEAARDLCDALASSIAASGAPHIVVVCPSSAGSDDADAAFADGFRAVAGADVVGVSEVLRRYPVGDVYDAFADREGHVPFTEAHFAALATTVARRIRVVLAQPKKVILVDCDDTLWGGVCGEVGTEGVVVDAPRVALQRFLLAQRAEGVLLCVVSRNNEADALAVFERSDMLIKREHLTTWRIDWSPKSENVASIARELRLGVDSFVLLDDDAYVCAEARERCPGLVALQLPEALGDLSRFLEHCWVFDRGRVTDEDRNRADAYRTQTTREDARAATSPAEFFAKLDLVVMTSVMQTEEVPRVAQLLHRTNQFNATGVRRTEAEVRALEAEGLETLVVRVRDRFGDYGITGVVIGGTRDRTYVVDSLLLSCRVLGRGVEHELVRQLTALAEQRGASELSFPFITTAKNAPYAAFFESLPAQRSETGDRRVAVANAGALLELRYDPESALPAGAEEATPAAPAPAHGEADQFDYRAVAATLTTVEDILRALPGRSLHEAAAPSAGSIEDELAAMWREVLNLAHVTADQDLFDIGGDSLVALRILTRVHEHFHVEIPLHRLFQAEATIAWMASEVRAGAQQAAGSSAASRPVSGEIA